MKRFFTFIAAAFISAMFVQPAEAGTVDAGLIDVTHLQTIFGQGTFYGLAAIDVRILGAQELVSPQYLDLAPDVLSGSIFSNPPPTIVSSERLDLFATGQTGPAINMFFVDSISSPFGFGFAAGIAQFTADVPAGSHQLPSGQVVPNGVWGNNIAIDRDHNPDSYAFNTIIAHEIGHSLGLHHRGGFFGGSGPNLMNSNASNAINMDRDQIITMLASPWLQGNAQSGFYIEIRPISVVAVASVSPVPLPAALPMLSVGLVMLGFVRRRRKPA